MLTQHHKLNWLSLKLYGLFVLQALLTSFFASIRFGIAAPPAASDEDARKKARLARFTPVSKTAAKSDPQEEEKRKARSLRYKSGQALYIILSIYH